MGGTGNGVSVVAKLAAETAEETLTVKERIVRILTVKSEAP
jgi:hypothetical protein